MSLSVLPIKNSPAGTYIIVAPSAEILVEPIPNSGVGDDVGIFGGTGVIVGTFVGVKVGMLVGRIVGTIVSVGSAVGTSALVGGTIMAVACAMLVGVNVAVVTSCPTTHAISTHRTSTPAIPPPATTQVRGTAGKVGLVDTGRAEERTSGAGKVGATASLSPNPLVSNSLSASS